jgi:hypothetical protein
MPTVAPAASANLPTDTFTTAPESNRPSLPTLREGEGGGEGFYQIKVVARRMSKGNR